MEIDNEPSNRKGVDISDILHSIQAPTHRNSAAPNPDNEYLSSYTNERGSSSSTPNALIQDLVRCYTNERCSPVLSPYPRRLLRATLSAISAQIQIIEQWTGAGGATAAGSLGLVILQTDLERVKFLARGIVRARLAKIEAYGLWYTASRSGAVTDSYESVRGGIYGHDNEGEAGLLSQEEAEFARRRIALLERYFTAVCLGRMPAPLRRLDDRAAGGGGMVEGPDVDAAVFVRALVDFSEAGGEKRVAGTDIRLRMKRGDVVVVRWSAVEAWVWQGKCELL